MKKAIIIIFIFLVILILFLNCNLEKKDNKHSNYSVYLMKHEKYKDISLDKIKKIEIIKYTEAGDQEEILENDADITRVYNFLKNIKIGKKTNMACDDNTTIYKMILIDDKEYNVEIECDWVIIDNKRYLLNK